MLIRGRKTAPRTVKPKLVTEKEPTVKLRIDPVHTKTAHKKAVRVTEGKTIAFTYRKLNGELRKVEKFVVENTFFSKKGHRIVQGIREDDDEGRSYRRRRMMDVRQLDPPRDE